MNNPSSALRLTDHTDGRVFSMVPNTDAESLVRPGDRFKAKADITNFYGSIYTHAIPWAIYGVEDAKSNQNDSQDWANRLDKAMSQGRRKETTGVAVGPGTSAIVGEILLNAVDKKLQGDTTTGKFVRFIDDYYFVGSSRDEAEEFVHHLRDILVPLKMAIHPGKTRITELPTPRSPHWKREIIRTIRGTASIGKMLDAIDQAIDSQDHTEEDGALRFALVALEERLNTGNAEELTKDHQEMLADRLLNIGFIRPIAVGMACRLLFAIGTDAVKQRESVLNLILREHVRNRRTDAATWLLYTLIRHAVAVDDTTVETIVESKDCMTLSLLTLGPKHRLQVEKFLEDYERRDPPDYLRDEYWLLYYQLLRKGTKVPGVPDEYYAEFQPLIDGDVSFIDLWADNPYVPYHAVDRDKRPIISGGSSGPYND